MNLKEKKKPLAVFLVGIVILAIFLFYDEFQEPEPAQTDQPFVEEEENQPVTMDGTFKRSQQREDDMAAQETTFWFWEGEESGVPSKEYLTLCGDGTYIINIELEGHVPADITGKWTGLEPRDGSGQKQLRLWRDGSKQQGIIVEGALELDGKTYQQTTCEHL